MSNQSIEAIKSTYINARKMRMAVAEMPYNQETLTISYCLERLQEYCLEDIQKRIVNERKDWGKYWQIKDELNAVDVKTMLNDERKATAGRIAQIQEYTC